MMGSLNTAVTGHKRPTFAEVEQRRHELPTQAGLHSQHQTSPASLDPAAPPTRAIRLPHLQAALALWEYCSYSATSLFGACIGDSVADRILEALHAAENGLTREQIRKLFHCRVGSGSIHQALEKLRSLQLVASRYVTGRGRPTTVWFAIDPACVVPTEEEAAEPDEFSEEADLPCLPCTF